ncbi:MAG TPA: YceI family protein [Chryseosolibacter sp.]
MEKQKFKILPTESKIEWIGSKVTGSHNGTIAIKGGELLFANDQLTGGTVIADTTRITILDITDPGTNAQFAGHLASDDFFSSQKYPEAALEITAVNKNEVVANLTIKGITNPLRFEVEISRTFDIVTARAKAVIDRTAYDMKFRSGNFFTNLGDTLIYNDFELYVTLSAKAVNESVSVAA